MNLSADAPFARFAAQCLSAHPVSGLRLWRAALSTGPWQRCVVRYLASKRLPVAPRKAAGSVHHSGRWTDHRQAPLSRQEIDQQFFALAELVLRSRLVLLLGNQMA